MLNHFIGTPDFSTADLIVTDVRDATSTGNKLGLTLGLGLGLGLGGPHSTGVCVLWGPLDMGTPSLKTLGFWGPMVPKALELCGWVSPKSLVV